jgi:predicted DNA-binding helix-hairpin-helix protein
MKRVYYSGYVPVNLEDTRLPALLTPPLVRENRLYQADWLMRFYQFNVNEIVNEQYPDLDLELDPKLAYALRHPELFPIDVNTADYELILRIPGVGVKSAKLIVTSRRYGRLTLEHLRKMGVVTKRSKYFITSNELPILTINEVRPENLRQLFVAKSQEKVKNKTQLVLGL